VADTGSGSVDVERGKGSVSADTGSGSVSLRSSAQPSMEIRIDTGSGGVDVNAPGATIREHDDVTSVRMKVGSHGGVIDTGSGSVTLAFQ
jgi:hypothetical protein